MDRNTSARSVVYAPHQIDLQRIVFRCIDTQAS
jgi:hypothetical protein